MKRTMLLLGATGLFFGCLLACSKNTGEMETPPEPEVITPPVLSGDSISGITTSAAVFYGKITDNGGGTISARGVYWGEGPSSSTYHASATSYTTDGRFNANLKNLVPNTTYHVRGYAVNSSDTSFSADISFTTTGVPQAVVFTDTLFATGATTAFVAGKLVDGKGIETKEIGICISKNPDPTIADTKVKAADANEQNLFLRINNLEPSTTYHIRTYATNVYGNTVYGADATIQTIAKGNVTYTLNQSANPTEEQTAAYARIKTAFDEAMVYYNNFTSITKHLNVNYVPGVPTADASINGTIRMGSNTGYQRTGTALHEIAHAVGVGQHWMWAANLIQGGVYQGTEANRMLRFMTRNPAEAIKGDGLHFWPYGINGANEDTGDEMLYITNVLILQGMKADGLPSSY